jgi:hypothetical protein
MTKLEFSNQIVDLIKKARANGLSWTDITDALDALCFSEIDGGVEFNSQRTD